MSTPEQALTLERLAQATEPFARAGRRAAIVSVLPPLLWLPQAALIAHIMASALQDAIEPVMAALALAAYVLFGMLRAYLTSLAGALSFEMADATVERERAQLVERESRRSRLSTHAPSSAGIAALAADKLLLLRPFLTQYVPARMRLQVVPVVIVAIAFWFSWVAGLIFVVTGPLIPVFMALIGAAAQSVSEKHLRELGTLNGFLLERIRALADIQLLDAGKQVVTDLADRAAALRKRTMAVLAVAFLSSAVLELFSAIGIALLAVYVGFSLLGLISFGAYGQALSPFAGLLVLLIAPAYYQPLRELAVAWHDRASALAVAAELRQAENAPSENIVGQGAFADGSVFDNPLIRTSGVCIQRRDRGLLKLPDLEIRPGDTVALTGVSGAGKSTMLALLAGLIRPDHGTIELNGMPLTDELADAWRSHVGWLDQTPQFLNASVRANLMPGASRHDHARIEHALEIAHATQIVDALADGLDTRLGEAGAGVSGGEARRLMLASVFCASPDVLLADEPTADLDDETAGLVVDSLLRYAQAGRTLIIATHDEHLIRRLDRRINIGVSS